MPTPNPQIPPEVIAAIDRGEKITAIKLLRDATGLGLKEAKDAVDHIEAGGGFAMGPRVATASRGDAIASALERGDKLEATRLYRDQRGVGLKEAKDAVDAMLDGSSGDATGRAPGGVSRAGGFNWPIVLAIAVGIAAYYFWAG